MAPGPRAVPGEADGPVVISIGHGRTPAVRSAVLARVRATFPGVDDTLGGREPEHCRFVSAEIDRLGPFEAIVYVSSGTDGSSTLAFVRLNRRGDAWVARSFCPVGVACGVLPWQAKRAYEDWLWDPEYDD